MALRRQQQRILLRMKLRYNMRFFYPECFSRAHIPFCVISYFSMLQNGEVGSSALQETRMTFLDGMIEEMQTDLAMIKRDAEAAQLCLDSKDHSPGAVSKLRTQLDEMEEELLKNHQLMNIKTKGEFIYSHGPVLFNMVEICALFLNNCLQFINRNRRSAGLFKKFQWAAAGGSQG